MKKFILGTKQNMTQYWGEDGKVSPATVVVAGPITVTQVKTNDKDGYTALQVGFGDQKKERLSKSVLGHTKDAAYKTLREFRAEDAGKAVGDIIDVSAFEKGDMVVVAGISKGKGFQGVVKRHGFHGDKRTHGRKHSERKPGSIGGGLRTRVPKGMRMAGRMGNDRVSVKNLEVLLVDKATNTILIKGALPGRRGTLLEITA
jgi:large subunit ribosomal protein L3